MKSITARDAIYSRESLSKDITRMWGILYTENVTEKNYKRNNDMKAIFKKVLDMSEKRVDAKLKIQLINMGYKKQSETPSSWLYPLIYQLSEKNELFVKLGTLPTLDPTGKLKTFKTEAISRKYVSQLREKLQLEIVAIRKKLDDYNDKAVLILD